MKLKHILLSSVLIILVACGGGNGSTASPQQEDPTVPHKTTQTVPLQIRAVSSTQRAILNESTEVTVVAESDNGEALQLTRVTPRRSDACRVTEISGLSYRFENSSVGECVFDYEVEPVSPYYSGVTRSSTRVAVSRNYFSPELPILSKTVFVGRSLTVDLKFSLGSDWPVSVSTGTYQLDSSRIIVQGAADSVVSLGADLANPTVTIAPTDVSHAGVTRVSYSISDGVDTKLGVIDFTVSYSDGVNQRPIANDYVYKGYVDPNGITLQLDNMTDENGNTFSLVSDPDGDALALVRSSNYDLSLEDPQTSDLSFFAKPTRSGPNTIPYTVKDGYGGFATGLIHFTPEPDLDAINQSWDDITIDANSADEVTFLAPLTRTLANMLYVDYSSVYSENGTTGPIASTVMLTTYEQARDYCAFRNARLPTRVEIERLINSRNGNSLYAQDNWPTGASYWSVEKSSDLDAYVYDLGTGQQGVNNMSAHNYVTCVGLSEKVETYTVTFKKLTESGNQYEAQHGDGYGYMEATVFDPYGNIAPHQNVDVMFSSQRRSLINLAENNPSLKHIRLPLVSNEDGRFYFVVREDFTTDIINAWQADKMIGSYAYTIREEGESESAPIIEMFAESGWRQYKYEPKRWGNANRDSDNSVAKLQVDAGGLFLWNEDPYSGNSSLSKYWAINTLQEQFSGKNFSARLTFLQRDYLNRTGIDYKDTSISFSLQQKDPNPTSSQAAQDMLGIPDSQHTSDEIILPGVGVSDDRALTIMLRRKENDQSKVYISALNTRADRLTDAEVEARGQIGPKNHYEVYWIDYIDGVLKVYSAAVNHASQVDTITKPANPVLESTTIGWGSIDPSQPYYIMIGYYIYSGGGYSISRRRNTAYLTTLGFKSWD